MEKARSRLKRTEQAAKIAEKKPARFSRGLHFPHLPRLLIRYIRHLPALLLGLAGYGIIWYILNTVPPERLRDVIFSGFYLPVLLLFLATNFFCLAFLLLNSRRGWVSVYLTYLLFLRLQAITYTVTIVVPPLIIFAILEIILIVLKSNNHENRA